MRDIVSLLRSSSDILDFLVELSAGVIFMALWSSQGFGSERSIGFLTLADGGKYSASLSAFDLNPSRWRVVVWCRCC